MPPPVETGGIGALVREFNAVGEGLSTETKPRLSWRERRRLAREAGDDIPSISSESRTGSIRQGPISRRPTDQSGFSQGSHGSHRSSLRKKLPFRSGSRDGSEDITRSDEGEPIQEKFVAPEGGRTKKEENSPADPEPERDDGGLETVQERPKAVQHPSSVRPPPAPSQSVARQLQQELPPSQSTWQRLFNVIPASAQVAAHHRRHSSEDDENARDEPEPITTSRQRTPSATKRILNPLSGHTPSQPSSGDKSSLPTHVPRPDTRPNLHGTSNAGSETSLNPRHAHPKLNQDLNQPFIPRQAGYQTSPSQRFFGNARNTISSYLAALEPTTASPNRSNNEIDSEAPLRTIAALIATTGNITGAVSPAIAAIAPVWSYEDQGAIGGGSGGRRLARYSRKEAQPDLAMQEEIETEYKARSKRRDRKSAMVKRKDEKEDRARRRERVRAMTGNDASQRPGHRAARDSSGGNQDPNKPIERTSSQIDPDPHGFRDSSRLKKRTTTDDDSPYQSEASGEDSVAEDDRDDPEGAKQREVQHNAKHAKKGEATDKQLQDIDEEGVNDILRTEGADVNAFKGEYDEGGFSTAVPSPSSGEKEELAEPDPPSKHEKLEHGRRTAEERRRREGKGDEREGRVEDEDDDDWANSSEEDDLVEDEEGRFDWDEAARISDEEKQTRLDRDAEKGDVGRSWREKKRWGVKSGKYAGWVGSRRGERMQQEIYMFVFSLSLVLG